MLNSNFKKDMINDMVKILKDKNISNISKKHILDMYCWILTERIEPYNNATRPFDEKSRNAKYKGCTYWTKEAFESYYVLDEKNEKYKIKKGASIKKLRHEHVIPRKVFNDYIINNKEIDKNIINDYFIGCVVTKDQAKSLDKEYKDKMPNNLSFSAINEDNLWARYKSSKIQSIYEIDWEIKPNRLEISKVKEIKL